MIIGITGTNGAGKGTVVDYLVKEKGFTHYSARDLIVEEVRCQGLEIDRTSMRAIGNSLREQHGPAYIAEELCRRATEVGGDAVIESIRNSGEAAYLRDHGASLWTVDADRRVRYERIQARASETDKIQFDVFVEQEEREWHGALGKADMDIMTVVKMADVTLTNDGTQEDLYRQVEEALRKSA